MYSVIAQTVEAAVGGEGAAGTGYGRVVVMGGIGFFVVAFLVLLFCYLFYRRRLEHRQVMAAIERGMEPGGLAAGVPGLVWITSLTVGLGLLIIGIGVFVLGGGAVIFKLGGVASAGVGLSLVVYGLLRRGAERRALALEQGIPLSEIERPNPIMSLWVGAGLLVLLLPLFFVLQSEFNTTSALLFSICSAAGVGLLVRGCLLRRAERRYLSKEKGIRFSGRRRSKFTKSILLGIGFVLFSLFFLYIVIEGYRRGNRDQEWQLLFFAVLFTLGVIFFVRAALVRRRRGRRVASSAEADTSESSMASH